MLTADGSIAARFGGRLMPATLPAEMPELTGPPLPLRVVLVTGLVNCREPPVPAFLFESPIVPVRGRGSFVIAGN